MDNMQTDSEQGRVEDAEPTLMSQTGRNAAYAVGLALGVAFAFSLAYTLLSLIGDTVDRKQIDFWTIPTRVFGFFQVTSICAAPIVFLISFALLQRHKIKYRRRSVE